MADAMSLRDHHHRLDMDATAGGRGASAQDAQWLSLGAAIAAVPAGIIVGAAMAASCWGVAATPPSAG